MGPSIAAINERTTEWVIAERSRVRWSQWARDDTTDEARTRLFRAIESGRLLVVCPRARDFVRVPQAAEREVVTSIERDKQREADRPRRALRRHG